MWEKEVWQFLKKLNIITIWPSNPTPRNIPREMKTFLSKDVSVNVYNSTVYNSPKVETTQTFIKCWINTKCGMSIQWNIFHPSKRTKYWYILQEGWTLKTLCWVKEARHKRPADLWLYLYEMSRVGQIIHGDRKQMSGCQGRAGRRG